VHRSGPHGEVRGILISVLGHSGPSLYGSGAGRVSIARLAETPFTRPPRRSARPQSEERSDRPDRGHGGHARSSPTQNACDGEPGSRRPPGGRVAVWNPNYKFITTKRLRTLTPSPPHARAPLVRVTTCAPSVPHATAGSIARHAHRMLQQQAVTGRCGCRRRQC
jgi:hypothetical protein